VVRPRTTPLLTPFETPSGTKHVWTTFSSDQIDLNYANPAVLVEVVRVLLEYVHQGADIVRLDAVTYLWKEPGHPSVHHPKTHAILKLLRAVVEAAAPHVILLTETNVPHEENVSYFGDGFDEAQLVYNFALPPLVLHSVLEGDARALSAWAKTLKTPSNETWFFNFLASHDGIGVRGVEAILGAEKIARLAAAVTAHGGLVSYKTNSDGSQSPYELNISYFDALSNPKADEPLELQLERFVCAHAVMLSLAGVPGLYVHSLLGSRSFHQGVQASGMKRSINREKFELEALERALADPRSLRARVLARLSRLLEVRRSERAFHPQAPQQVLDTPSEVFAIRRGEGVLCYHNVSGKALSLPLAASPARDLLTGEVLHGNLPLPPYGVRWLEG
jgi:sucrose phosphorylase